MKYSARLFVFAIGVALLFVTMGEVSWSQTQEEPAGVHFVSPDGDATWEESVDKSEPCSPETAR